MERPDTGSPAAPGPGAVPPEPPTQLTPPAEGAETVSPTPPPSLAREAGSETPSSLAAGVPPALAGHSRYRVIRLLGQGGMGAVYLAEHRHMERQVALKVISPDLINNSEAVRRFRQEVTAAARLGPHPNVVAVHDAEQVGDLHFLAMEFVEGQSLADYLRTKGPLPIAEACDYVRQAALGLQHASEQGMVHRDVKPHNLMRTPQGQIKVLDFGLARCGRETEKARTQLTQQGVLMGTADYMAPEQANDSRVADIRADIYSLGCTLYHLLTGRVPFPEGGTVDKIIKHAVEAPFPVGAMRRDLPIEVVRIVEKMMAKEVDKRFQSPGEVAAALAPWSVATPRSTGPVTVLPAAAATSLSKRPTLRPFSLPQLSTIVSRRIRWSANWLMLAGYLNGLMGFVMLFIPGALIRVFGPVAIILATLILIGAIKMKARQSYRWALTAAYLTLVPASFCFPFTVFFGMRALTCLSDSQVRASFPP
jgi:serine/threonine protein kinase